MYFRFGEPGEYGSEHTINDKKFPVEIQLIGFNSGIELILIQTQN